jgi:hypothetical protein
MKVFETLSHVDENIVTNVLEGRNSSSSGSSNQAVLDPNYGGITLFRMVCKRQWTRCNIHKTCFAVRTLYLSLNKRFAIF